MVTVKLPSFTDLSIRSNYLRDTINGLDNNSVVGFEFFWQLGDIITSYVNGHKNKNRFNEEIKSGLKRLGSDYNSVSTVHGLILNDLCSKEFQAIEMLDDYKLFLQAEDNTTESKKIRDVGLISRTGQVINKYQKASVIAIFMANAHLDKIISNLGKGNELDLNNYVKSKFVKASKADDLVWVPSFEVTYS